MLILILCEVSILKIGFQRTRLKIKQPFSTKPFMVIIK